MSTSAFFAIHGIIARSFDPTSSIWWRCAALREALARAHGVLGRVRKTRWLLLAGPTRIHLDRVENLGEFMELEVVLRDEQSLEEGQAIAESLMKQLGIAADQRLAGAYLDLLSPSAKAAGTASTK